MKKITFLLTLFMSSFAFAQYCTNGPTTTVDSNVQQVDLTGATTTISHTGCPGVTGAEDLTVQAADLVAGTPYTLNVTFGTCGGNYGGAGEIWIDYNQNMIFEASESVGTSTGTPGTAPWDAAVAFTVTVPVTAINGATRMRVKQEEGGANPLDPCSDYNWGSVMDFTINVSGGTAPPSCLAPNTLTASAITSSQANLGWTSGGSGETMWDVEVVTSGSAATGTPTDMGVGNPFTKMSLTGNTPYDFYVRADCGGSGASTWSGPFTFTTLCDPLVAPYVEGFETMTPAADVAFTSENCWTGVSSGFYWELALATDTGSTGTGPATAVNTGNYFYTEATTGATGDITELLSPLVDVSGLTTPALRFNYHMFGTDMGTLHVDVYDGAAWNNDIVSYAGQQQTAETDVWRESLTDLTSLTITGPVQVRFRGERGTQFTSDMSLDNFSIDEMPTCITPASLVVTNITASTADLGWTSTESAWDIEYGVTPFTPTGTPTITNTANNPENVTGLTADTEYQFMVRSNCGGSGTSTWAGPFTFRTLCNAVTAPYVEDFESMTPAADVAFASENCWSGVSTGFYWELALGTDAGSAGTGPAAAVNTGNYFYTEATTGAAGDITELLSPSVDVSGLTTPALKFNYHMFGADMGTLHVDVYDGAAWNMDVVSFTGQQQTAETDLWLESLTDLSTLTITGNIQVRFRGERGTDFTSDMSLDNFSIDEMPTCTQVVIGSSTIMPDCANSQFNIDVDVTTVGDATEITDGVSTWPISGTGVTTAGPFTDGATVSLSVTHSDTACDLALGNFTYICPPPNDECANATVLIPSTTGAEVWTAGTTIGNTASGELIPTCGDDGSGRDVWYTVEVPAAGDITVLTRSVGGSPLTDTVLAIYSGTCGTFTQIACNDDGGAGSAGNFSGIALTGQTPGAILYVRVNEYGAAASKLLGPQDGPFEITAHAANPALGVEEVNEIEGFSLYPNPVANTLKVSAQDNIDSLQVMNMLGQVVKTATPNLNSYELDMSSLAIGVYFVKVNVNNVEGTYRIIKQ